MVIESAFDSDSVFQCHLFVFGHLGSSCSAGAAGQTTKEHYSLSEGLSSTFFSERLTSALTFGGVELSNSIHVNNDRFKLIEKYMSSINENVSKKL